MPTAVYGTPPPDVIETPRGAQQVSPLIPGSADLGAMVEASLDEIAVMAPPGAVEARYVLAQALSALRPGGVLTAAAPKDKGGLRLKKTLIAFGCEVDEISRRHHRICTVTRPADAAPLSQALADGAPQQGAEGLWTQPGVFSWDRQDPGTRLLLANLPALSGAGADFGSGLGWVARQVLASPAVTSLDLVEVDRRALEASRRNIADARARFHWADVRHAQDFENLDFVAMNPPFHDAGAEDKGLGQAFIGAAAQALRKGGVLWVVANRHLPYEAPLNAAFRAVRPVADASGFKVYEARK